MDPDVLREQLVLLHEELGLARRVDPRSAQLLGEILEDIKRLLERSSDAAERPPAGPSPVPAVPPTALPLPPLRAPAEPRTLPDRLELLAVQFEVDHPTLAASSRRLVDILGKAGL
jgi:hypothetical protein